MRTTNRQILGSLSAVCAALVLIGCASDPAAQSTSAAPAPVAAKPAVAEVPQANVKWSVYNANALPTTPRSVVLATGVVANFKLADGKAATAKEAGGVLRLDTSASKDMKSMYELPNAFAANSEYPKVVTVIARAKALSKLRTTELDIAIPTSADNQSPARVKLNIRQAGTSQGSGLQLEKVDGSKTTLIYPFDTKSDFHTYQISTTLTSATTGSVDVYINGNDTPVLSYPNGPIRKGGKRDNYVAFGDSSPGTAFQADIDWIVWSTDTCKGQACKPSQLKASLAAL